jgi:hypothetical protein
MVGFSSWKPVLESLVVTPPSNLDVATKDSLEVKISNETKTYKTEQKHVG